MTHFRFSAALFGLLGGLVFACHLSADEGPAIRFSRDISPLLSANCFQCHGPDAEHRAADLRLDQEEGVAAMFGGGDLAQSEAWARITSSDPDLQMPPPEAHKELKPEEIALIKRWIEQGAVWEGYWAFIPPTQAEVPKLQDESKVHNPIDAFIQARLEMEGLAPSEEADRERLLRRVTLDLTGLPPTIAEIDAFLADESPDAYEKVVDRLLRSPHYGERMTLMWLDAARYGDSSVFHADGPRHMWPWRDWVIKAYNDNKPFDQFTVEQLAGDLLPDSTVEQKVATGFLRNNPTTDEGGAIAEEYRIAYAVDRVRTTSMIWLGLTMECAQCHDHKYDPITQEEYYRFFAYFNQASDPGMQTRNGNQSPVVDIFDEASLAKAAQLKAELPQWEEKRNARRTEAQSDFHSWAVEAAANAKDQPLLPGNALVHLPLDVEQGAEVEATISGKADKAKVHGSATWVEGKHGKAFKLDGGNFIDVGDVASFERDEAFSYGAWIKPEANASGAPIARMDDGQAHRGFDLYTAGGRVAVHIINTWPSNALKVTTKNQLKPDQWQHVFATYDGSSKAAGIKIYFDGVEQEWDIEQDQLSETIRTDRPLYIGRRNPGSPFKGEIDEVRLYDRLLSETDVQALAGSDPIGPLLAKGMEAWTDEEKASLESHYLNTHDQPYQEISQQLAKLKSEIAAAEKPISDVMVMKDVDTPRMTYVLERGSYDAPNKDRPVEPGTPTVLPPLPEGAPANRLALAQWLVRDDHPLTARVTVNRYWYMLFGTGLVPTVEDFGAQGEWPSHPELLDYLAVDFVENGWDIKRLLKQMVMSHTYRQTSRITPQLQQQDPENRLLARGARFRLQGEFIRDNALAASGLLVDEIGHASVKPYQPPGLWNEVSLSGERFVQDKGEKLYRRSMYTYWKRSAPAPAMTIFDAPSRETCVLRRSRTNTPLQALVTLNDPQFVEAARALAQRVTQDGGQSLESQITYAYRLATGVTPRPTAVAALKSAYEEELAVFQAEPDRAKQLLAIGESPRDETIDAAHHAALTVVCSMILNLDALITRG
ncbi:MAG: DUF1553 domain-containing protein [Pirellulaceae bacterium]